MIAEKCVVLFSGGQDSTTCLFWAKKNFEQVFAVSFDYGQKHRRENQKAKEIAEIANVPIIFLTAPALAEIGNTALTSEIPIEKEGNLPNTFVPGRNLVFLTLAAGWAYFQNITHLVGGMCETDFSGYPDCRLNFIKSAEKTISLALDKDFSIHTPLMFLNKAQTWKLAQELQILDLIKQNTLTCYEGNDSLYHEWGFGCGVCPACELRKKGYEEFLELKD